MSYLFMFTPPGLFVVVVVTMILILMNGTSVKAFREES